MWTFLSWKFPFFMKIDWMMWMYSFSWIHYVDSLTPYILQLGLLFLDTVFSFMNLYSTTEKPARSQWPGDTLTWPLRRRRFYRARDLCTPGRPLNLPHPQPLVARPPPPLSTETTKMMISTRTKRMRKWVLTQSQICRCLSD